ncbi:glycosyltransferase [Thermoproteota archaeon]
MMVKKMKVDVVIPVYNEEKALSMSTKGLHSFLSKNLKGYDWSIIIADNASTDSTLKIAKKLSKKVKRVGYVHLDKKGRGRALRKVWLKSKADIVSYMDVDLSTGLKAFPKMIDALAGKKRKKYQIGIGTRLVIGSETNRCLNREILSRGYNIFLKMMLFTSFTDAQCGFKAVTREAVEEIVSLTKNNKWFFDTEMLVLAEKKKYNIFEVPVTWIEDKDSKVHILRTIWEFISSVVKMRIDLFRRGIL